MLRTGHFSEAMARSRVSRSTSLAAIPGVIVGALGVARRVRLPRHPPEVEPGSPPETEGVPRRPFVHRIRKVPHGRWVALAMAVAIAVLLITTLPAWGTGAVVDTAYDMAQYDGTCASGYCTLREAIETANQSSDPSFIRFSDDILDGRGNNAVLKLDSALPPITSPVTIEASGWSPHLSERRVLITPKNQSSFPCSYYCNGLTLLPGASGSKIKGLTIHGFPQYGISIEGASYNRIEDSYIGTDETGAGVTYRYFDPQSGTYIERPTGNGLGGIQITNGDSNTIGGDTPAERNIISGNDNFGIKIEGGSTNTEVQHNYIGTDITGTQDLSNTDMGVAVFDAPNNFIGERFGAEACSVPCNVISGNLLGVYVQGNSATGNKVRGNYIGTDASGTAAVPNVVGGVRIYSAPNNYVGDDGDGFNDPEHSNVISGNGGGIELYGASGNQVRGNLIGTKANGTEALPNSGDGVGITKGSSNNTIGGTTPEARNTISGNGRYGVSIEGSGSTGNKVQGNYVGTGASGVNRLGNAQGGVAILGGKNNLLGGPSGARNVISANAQNGVSITGSGASDNTVQGNHIGTNASGSTPLGNSGDGVFISNSSNNAVGGTAAEGNTIAHNEGDGVSLDSGGTGNRILSGSIYANGQLGIDLANDGVTRNDVDPNGPNDDQDAGPNRLQNFPVVKRVAEAGSSVTVFGTLESTPNSTFSVEVYRNSAPVSRDASGHGEGQTLVGQTTATTDGQGEATFTVTGTGSINDAYSATATDTTTNDTSEFGPAYQVPPVAVDDAASTTEDTAKAIDVLTNDTDDDRDDIDVADYDQTTGEGGTVSCDLESGVCTYTPPGDFSGEDTFTYTATDGIADSNQATVTITVTPVDDAPVAANDSYSTPQAQGLKVDPPGVLSNDTDVDPLPDGLKAIKTRGPQDAQGEPVGTLTLANDGSFVYEPPADFSGEVTFEYEACDDGRDSCSAPATVSIAVTPEGGAPVARSQRATTGEDAPVKVTLGGIDGEGDDLTFRIEDGPAKGTLSDVGPVTCSGTIPRNCSAELTYTPNNDYNGSDSFSFVANDGISNSDRATATITVAPVNDKPTAQASPSSLNISEDAQAQSVVLSGTDIETGAPALTFEIIQAPTNGALKKGTTTLTSGDTFTGSPQDISYKPNKDFNGSDSFSFKATDRGDPDDCTTPSASCDEPEESGVVTVPITVSASNDPELSIDDVTIAEGDDGTTNARFTVNLSAPASAPVAVDYATMDGTATSPTDYAATSGTLTFASGDSTGTVSVPVVGDGKDEPDETFTVELSNTSGATIGDEQGQGTISDDDPTPSPPVNDDFADGQAVSGGTASANGTIVAATRESGEPDHITGNSSLGEHSVWYRWTSSAAGRVTIDTCTTNTNTVLAAYTGGSFGNLSRVADNDDGCSSGSGSKVTFDAQTGATHQIAVAGLDNGDEGTFALKLALADNVPPSAPVITGPANNSYDTDGNVTVSGTAEKDTIVELFEEGSPNPVGTGTADATTGNWSIDLSGAGEGSHTYTAKATDASGNTSGESNAVTVIVDKTAPVVGSVTTPANGAIKVSRSTNVTATFSETMDPKTLTNNFTLKNTKTGAQEQATVSSDGKTVMLDPSATKLAKKTKYEVRIKGGTGGAKDLAGNALATDKVWSFTTGKK